jgi:protein arginine kinase activator
VNGNHLEVHVCEKCIPQISQADLVDFDLWDAVGKLAASKGKADPAKAIEPAKMEISAQSLLIPAVAQKTQECPNCGFTNEDVRKTGRLGCSTCYEVFEDMLKDVINDCQKGTQHMGKIPKAFSGVRRERLEEELRKAVETERFEDAALIRDQLAQLTA